MLISLFDIRFSYPGRPPALDGVSVDLAEGERLCITGANGAGKSTLLRIIVGLAKPKSGTVTVFGKKRLAEADFLEVRRRVGLVFQDPDDQLFCPTVAEDVAFGPLNLGKTRDEAEAIVETTLRNLDLLALRDRVTHKLSGGEKRLVSLATVLAMAPDVLLLDEPTNGLDTGNQRRLFDSLSTLPQAMILISHDEALRAALATRTVRLEQGRIVDENGVEVQV